VVRYNSIADNTLSSFV